MINTHPRRERGQSICGLGGQIQTTTSPCEYRVKSQSSGSYYDVVLTELGWICSCPDHIYRNEKCKHIWAVEFSRKLKEAVEKSVVIQSVNVQSCPRCVSAKIVKAGIRHNKSCDVQRYVCDSCKYTFTINLGFEKMHATPQAITSAMQLYFTGESLRNVQKFLKLQGVKVSHVAVLNWIRKYVALTDKYLEQITPQVSETWRADEMYVKIKGNPKYLFALMDDETRFRISQMVADHKGTSDVTPLLAEGKEIAKKKPDTFITDGAANYHEAYLKEFWTLKGPRTEHMAHIRLQGDVNTNKMERQNGEVRDREKVMRGLKRDDTPILKGFQIFHNYFREHEALKGKTPAEAAGIKIEGQNKWLTLIQNASKQDKQS